MKLKVGRRYLVTQIQTNNNATEHYCLKCIKCIESTETSYKIQYENLTTTWVKKEWNINILEELKNNSVGGGPATKKSR